MSLSHEFSSERDRQHREWLAAKARLNATVPKARKLEVVSEKPVERIEQQKPIVAMVPVAPVIAERDWLCVATAPTYAVADIVKEVCQQFGISRTEILSERRNVKFANPRHVAMTLAKHLTSRSLPEIARLIGNRDHTTVIHACKKFQLVIEAVACRVEVGSPIDQWVTEFKREMALTKPVARKPYVRRSIAAAN